MKAFNFDTALRMATIDASIFGHAEMRFIVDDGKLIQSNISCRESSWYLEEEWFPIFQNEKYIGYVKYLPEYGDIYDVFIDKHSISPLCIPDLEYISIEELLDNSDIYIYGTETYDYIKEICR